MTCSGTSTTLSRGHAIAAMTSGFSRLSKYPIARTIRLAAVAALRAFPVVYAVTDVSRSAGFWERLGFERFFELPFDGEPGYMGLRRGTTEIAIVLWDWPNQRYGLKPPSGPRFEMCVYVDDLDTVMTDLCNDGFRLGPRGRHARGVGFL
jgi:lactoylglutathione lyase